MEKEFGIPFPGRILPQDRWSRTALKKLPIEGPLEFADIFGRTAPIVLDLGCGNGRFLIASACARPELDHLGIDILPVVIRYATRRANQRGLANVRFAVRGAWEFLHDLVPPHRIREIHIYHPQPYHDSKKMEKRLLTPEFLGLVHRSLDPGGLFVIQTDSAAYWEYLLTVMPNFFEFQEQKGPWPDAPEGRTRREIIARRQGLPVFRGWGKPRSDLEEDKLWTLAQKLLRPRFETGGKKFSRRRVTEK